MVALVDSSSRMTLTKRGAGGAGVVAHQWVGLVGVIAGVFGVASMGWMVKVGGAVVRMGVAEVGAVDAVVGASLGTLVVASWRRGMMKASRMVRTRLASAAMVGSSGGPDWGPLVTGTRRRRGAVVDVVEEGGMAPSVSPP